MLIHSKLLGGSLFLVGTQTDRDRDLGVYRSKQEDELIIAECWQEAKASEGPYSLIPLRFLELRQYRLAVRAYERYFAEYSDEQIWMVTGDKPYYESRLYYCQAALGMGDYIKARAIATNSLLECNQDPEYYHAFVKLFTDYLDLDTVEKIYQLLIQTLENKDLALSLDTEDPELELSRGYACLGALYNVKSEVTDDDDLKKGYRQQAAEAFKHAETYIEFGTELDSPLRTLYYQCRSLPK